MIIDTHCHLDYLDKPWAEVKQQANDLGVTRFMTIAVEEAHWEQLLEFGRDPDIDVALGIHPCDLSSASEGWQDRLLKTAKDPRVVAIGETGLDNYHRDDQKKIQNQGFKDHAEIADMLKKPLVVHMRDARDEVLRFITHEYQGRGILHCFSEDYETAKQAIDQGFLISFSGIVTFKNALQIQDVAKKLPLDTILVETDSPYLAPMPYRGKKNYPGYTRYVAEKIAELKHISLEEVAEQTTKNFIQLIQP